MGNFIHGKTLIEELIKQGIADKFTRRVTIDIPVDGVPSIYIEKYGDNRLIDLMPAVTAGANVVASLDTLDGNKDG